MLVFGAGGVGNIPLPLRMPGLEPDFAPRQRDYRVTFMGRSDGANDRLGVRAKMLRVFEGRPEFVRFPLDDFPSYCDRIRRSDFVLCPSGFGPTSFRLYETLTLGSVPVYIHPGVPWLPYADELDWSELAVVVADRDLASLPDRLASMDETSLQRMRKNSRGLQPLLYHSRHCQVGPAATRAHVEAPSMRLYTLCNKAHEPLLEEFLAPTAQQVGFELRVERLGPDHEMLWGTAEYNLFLIAKSRLILRAIDEQPGTLFAYADADIQFFPEAVVDNMQWIAESERDRYSLWCQQDNLGGAPVRTARLSRL